MACPTDETLALFATGQLDPATRDTVIAHLETCNDCMSAVLAANEHLAEERIEETGSRWWMGAVAAAIAIAVVIAFPMLQRRNDPIRPLVAAVSSSERFVEPRLSGGFAWAPYRGPMRATEPANQPSQMKVSGVAADAIERAEKDHSARAERAAGIALTLVGKPDAAAAHLRSAGAWSDLAAAEYAEAMRTGRASALPAALDAANRAVAADPHAPEALFNRALILQHLGRGEDARAAWLRYLEVDPHSPWAAEARVHLNEIR